MEQKDLVIKGAREHNLKNIDVTIPKNKLVVVTGVSGSGKSSLAFNTLYEEGRRRYVESLSVYARQFLGGSEKPDVDSIDGLSPAISIDQKTISHNPRSTVGTVTDIYDHLRLLFARVGTPYCINGHGKITAMSLAEVIDNIKKTMAEDARIQVLAPVAKNQKGSFSDLFNRLRRDGYLRVKVDGEVQLLDNEIKLNKSTRHVIDIVVDRIVLKNDDETFSRLYDALEKATEYADGDVKIENVDTKRSELFSQNYACKICGFSIPSLEPRLFSFNSPVGACEVCKGLGIKLRVSRKLLIIDDMLSINQGGIEYYKNVAGSDNLEWQRLQVLCHHYLIDMDLPLNELPDEKINKVLFGSDEPIDYELTSSNGRQYHRFDYIEGIVNLIERRYIETTSEGARKYYLKFMREETCEACHGKRLNQFALSVFINKWNISDFCEAPIDEELNFVLETKWTKNQEKIAHLLLKELINRLDFLVNVGLSYLTLSRSAQTLSGGESQRIRLATQIGSKLSGILYVLDEPSIGLHQRDNLKLIKTLKAMRDLGNTLIVVEHDEETMLNADWLIDIGPLAGIHGGKIVAEGLPQDVAKIKDSITGQFLSKKRFISVPRIRRSGNGNVIEIKGAAENNLKKINVKFPLGKSICVTGVSGSGKSTLVNEILYKGLQANISRLRNIFPGKHKQMIGLSNVDKVIYVSQEPIGRTPRSNPATYTSVFGDIRDLFTATEEAKLRGYTKGRFSFNVKGGRCDHCDGDGVIKISMHFLPDVYVPCEICQGKRYNQETLQVKYKHKNIYDVLNMTIDEALLFFNSNNKIRNKLEIISDVGLGYIKLGQSAVELSGGEAQRVKLATYLQKKATGKTIYILDEPTTGLHSYDVAKLISILNRIVDKGDTVIVIEHNLDVIKNADYIIDLGPEGGRFGGELVATGTPEQVANVEGSFTGQFLREILVD